MFWIAPKSSSRIKALSSLCLGYFPPLVASVAQQLHDGCNCMREVRWAWKILLPENGPGLVGWGGGQSVEEEQQCGKKKEEQEEEK